MTPILIKSFVVAAAIDGYLIVAGAAGNAVAAAAANTDSLIGVADAMGADADGALDVVQAGQTEVRFGGDVDLGDPLTSDANGKAIKAVAAAGTTVRVIGYAMADGALDDIGPMLVAPGVIHQA